MRNGKSTTSATFQIPKHIVQVKAIKFKDLKGMISTDQLGQFFNSSAKKQLHDGHKSDTNSSGILTTAIKTLKKDQLVEEFNQMYDELKQEAGITPIIHKFDKKYSQDLFEVIEDTKKYGVSTRATQ